MLLTDAYPVTVADLAGVESEISEIATVEGVTLAGDNGSVAVALSEAATTLLSAARDFGVMAAPGLSVNHVAAVLNTGGWGPGDSDTPTIRLGQIVTTNLDSPKLHSPLKLWMLYRTLASFFRDAYVRHTEVGVYVTKYELYDQLAMQQFARVKSLGVPVVLIPLPCPGAVLERDAGSWSIENLSTVPEGADPGATWNIAVTWVDANYQSPSVRNNGESAGSAPVAITTEASQRIVVSIESLTPPSGAVENVGISRGIWTRRKAVGWNVYAGSGSELYLQNDAPIPVDTKTWQFPSAPQIGLSPKLGFGQFPDHNVLLRNMVRRG